MNIGITLGFLIGLVTGAVVILLLRTAMVQDAKDIKAILSIVGELLAIPTFWFGGPWLTTKMLVSINVGETLPSYMAALVCTFTLVALYPIVRLVIRTGSQIGQRERTNG
jgi:hypothetical protein